MQRIIVKKKFLRTGSISVSLFILLFLLLPPLQAVELSLNDALDIAVNKTSRGNIIKGNEDVAEQKYDAKKINFYFPEISINGQLPTYSDDESYRFFAGASEKALFKTKNLGLNSFIKLDQSLITGGDLEITANLTKSKEKYPYTGAVGGYFTAASLIDENQQQGFFSFKYSQPLLKPSDSKNELHNLKDDYEIARYTKMEETFTLKKEVTEAYVGKLKADLAKTLAERSLEKAQLQVEIDSEKVNDGVLNDEDFLASKALMLDAELTLFEAENALKEKNRELAMLLDIDPSEDINPVEPEVGKPIDEAVTARYISNWESSIAIRKAEHEYLKSKRSADYSASAHGLTGDLAVNYSFGRGTVKTDILNTTEGTASLPDDDIKTNSWGVSLNFTYPLWDGGASGAAVQAAEYEKEQARLEYEKAEQSARAEIVRLVNQLDVSYRRLDIIKKQIDLTHNKLNIADSRFKDGQISRVEYLESEIFYLEAKDKYLEELITYLTSRMELEGKFIS